MLTKDYIALGIILFLLFCAIRYIIISRKKGSCNGCCSQCGGYCIYKQKNSNDYD